VKGKFDESESKVLWSAVQVRVMCLSPVTVCVCVGVCVRPILHVILIFCVMFALCASPMVQLSYAHMLNTDEHICDNIGIEWFCCG